MLSLEGIRGLAALMVIFDHLHLIFFVELDAIIRQYLDSHVPYLVSKAGQYLVSGIHDGNFAVWVFWVMSAFVLSRKYFQLVKENRGEASAEYLTKSTLKRYPRLFIPILASVIFAYLLLAGGAMTNNQLYLSLGTHTSNEWLPTFYDFEPSLVQAIKSAAWDTFFEFDRDLTYNTVLWTMEVEFFGSIFLFGFLSLLGSNKLRWMAYPTIFIVLFFRGTHWLNAFVIGIALCDLYVNSRVFTKLRRLTGIWWFQILSSIVLLVLIGAPNYNEIFHLVVATTLVIFALSLDGYAKFFSSRVPVYLGKMSFSLYLIHIPILCSVTGLIYRSAEHYLFYPWTAITTSLITIALCMLVAHPFYEYADKQGVVLGGKLANLLQGETR